MTEHVENRFELLLEASKKFTQAMGLHDELMLEIFRAKSDWEFIIKIDAMLEAAAKAVVKKRLNSVPTELGEDLSFDGFVDAMPMNGRTSLLAFLKVDGCPNDVSGFIEAVRRLRNGFAHDIRLTDPRRTTTWFKKGKSWVNTITCRRNDSSTKRLAIRPLRS